MCVLVEFNAGLSGQPAVDAELSGAAMKATQPILSPPPQPPHPPKYTDIQFHVCQASPYIDERENKDSKQVPSLSATGSPTLEWVHSLMRITDRPPRCRFPPCEERRPGRRGPAKDWRREAPRGIMFSGEQESAGIQRGDITLPTRF